MIGLCVLSVTVTKYLRQVSLFIKKWRGAAGKSQSPCCSWISLCCVTERLRHHHIATQSMHILHLTKPPPLSDRPTMSQGRSLQMKVWKQTLCWCLWQVHSENAHPSPPTSERAGELPSSLPREDSALWRRGPWRPERKRQLWYGVVTGPWSLPVLASP